MRKEMQKILGLAGTALLLFSVGGCALPGVRVEEETKPREDPVPSESQTVISREVEYTVLPDPRVYVTTEKANAYAEPFSASRVIGILSEGTSLTVTRFAQTQDGRWGETEEGWILMDLLHPEDDDPYEYPIPAVVNLELIRIRKEPTSDSELVGHLIKGQQIYIQKIVEEDATKHWGRIEEGWVFLDYVDLYKIAGKEDYAQQNGTVTIEGKPLNIREGPSSVFEVVGKLEDGDRVTIFQEATVNGVHWGRIREGWICMDYVLLDKDKPKVPEAEPPEDRSILGHWLFCPEPENFSATQGPELFDWHFYDNGTFETGIISWKNGTIDGWTPGGSDYAGGVYTFDGKKLSMYYVDEGQLTVLETYVVKRDGDNRILEDSGILCPEGEDIPEYDMIRTLVEKNSDRQDTSILGSWVTLEEDSELDCFVYSNWIFYSDGRYEQYMIFYDRKEPGEKTIQQDRLREGVFLYSGGKLTIVRLCDSVAVSGGVCYESRALGCLTVKTAEKDRIVTDRTTFYEDMDFETLYRKVYG